MQPERCHAEDPTSKHDCMLDAGHAGQHHAWGTSPNGQESFEARWSSFSEIPPEPELSPAALSAPATKGDLLALYDAIRSTMNYVGMGGRIPDYVRDSLVEGMAEGHRSTGRVTDG